MITRFSVGLCRKPTRPSGSSDSIFQWDDKIQVEEELVAVAEALLKRGLNPKIVQLGRVAMAQAMRFPVLVQQNYYSMAWSPRIQAISRVLSRHVERGEIAVEVHGNHGRIVYQFDYGCPYATCRLRYHP